MPPSLPVLTFHMALGTDLCYTSVHEHGFQHCPPLHIWAEIQNLWQDCQSFLVLGDFQSSFSYPRWHNGTQRRVYTPSFQGLHLSKSYKKLQIVRITYYNWGELGLQDEKSQWRHRSNSTLSNGFFFPDSSWMEIGPCSNICSETAKLQNSLRVLVYSYTHIQGIYVI